MTDNSVRKCIQVCKDFASSAIILTIKQFLTVSTCPLTWVGYDLYVVQESIIYEETVSNQPCVFYVGQSDLAFARLWRHLHDGFKGRSLLGKFIRANWPHSMNFGIVLYHSGDPCFAAWAHDRNAIEAHLIARWSPCLNDMLNATPTPLPATYAPPTQNVTFPRHIGRMIREAEVAWQQAQNVTEW